MELQEKFKKQIEKNQKEGSEKLYKICSKLSLIYAKDVLKEDFELGEKTTEKVISAYGSGFNDALALIENIQLNMIIDKVSFLYEEN